MTLQQNTDRIQTTHIGSLPRPHDVLDLLRAKFAGQPYDEHVLDSTIANAVKEFPMPSYFRDGVPIGC
jgi:5-methyltetrahydropteroyltriglutamate--homocysteine methyltransferase